MRYVQRQLEAQLAKAFKSFPALVLTGPRCAGKTRLLRDTFPKADYHLLENPQEAPQSGRFTSAVTPDVQALPWRDFLNVV